ncbi:MAG: DUF6498-containing protein [Micropepsaceae bacterium]
MSETFKPLRTSIAEALQRPGAIWILLANAVPVAGVLFFGWQAFALLIFYWIENVILGVFNVLKVAVSGFTKAGNVKLLTLFLIPFFCIHYGIFCYVHGMFLIAVLTIAGAIHDGSVITPESFDLLPRVWHALRSDADLSFSVVVLVVVQLFSFAVMWLGMEKWRDTNPMKQMLEPYGRIVILHLTIFIACIPVIAIGQAQIGVLVLALMKCGLELGLPQFSFGLDKVPDELNLPDK